MSPFEFDDVLGIGFRIGDRFRWGEFRRRSGNAARGPEWEARGRRCIFAASRVQDGGCHQLCDSAPVLSQSDTRINCKNQINPVCVCVCECLLSSSSLLLLLCVATSSSRGKQITEREKIASLINQSYFLLLVESFSLCPTRILRRERRDFSGVSVCLCVLQSVV